MRLKENQFFRSVLVLMTGTIVAQAIAYLITPFLTRIYSTEEMGEYGIYMRIIAFISALATARYELALPLPKNDLHSYLIYRISLKIALFMLIISGLVGVVFIASQPFEPKLVYFVIATLLSALLLTYINLGTNWSVRKGQFRLISLSKMLNSTISNGMKWVLGIFNWGTMGLLWSSVIGLVLSAVCFIPEMSKQHVNYRKAASAKKQWVLLREYDSFPKVSLPHVLMDLGRDLLVAALIVSFFSKDIFGSYNHSYTMLRLPLMLVGVSISQVFLKRSAELFANGKSLYQLTLKTIFSLFLLSMIPFSIIFFYGEELFGFIFGSAWTESGYFSEIMTIWLFFNLILSPISGIPLVIGKQKEYFWMAVIGTFFQLFGFGILPLYLGNSKEAFMDILWFVTMSQAVYSLVVILMTLKFAKVANGLGSA